MTSNVYIARGEHNGIAVMKVGKANDVRQRVRQLGLSLEMSIAQPDAASAFAFEAELRFFVGFRGAKTLPGKNDWFYFDENIYTALCEAVIDWVLSKNQAQAELAELKAQLTMAQERDYQIEDIIVLNTIRVARLTNTPWEDIRALLASGYRDENLPPEFADIYSTKAVYSDMPELETQLTNANTEIERLREDNTAKDSHIEELIAELAQLQTRYEALKETLEAKRGD